MLHFDVESFIVFLFFLEGIRTLSMSFMFE